MADFVLTRRSALAVMLATVLGAIPRGLPAGERTAAQVRRGYHKGRYGQIHYRIARTAAAGGQRPLLCLHGTPYSGRIYETLLAILGTDRIAVAPDTPGYGDSDPPARAPSMADYAAAIGDLIDAGGYDEVDLLGYHGGSALAVELARQRPQQVRRIALLSAPVFTRAQAADRSGQPGPVELTADGAHLAAAWSRLVGRAMPGWTLDHVASQFPDVIRRPAISWWGDKATLDYSLADRLADLRQPILVLNPEDELQEQTRRARTLAANIEFRELPGWRLGFLDIRANELAQIVRDFLNERGA